MPKDVGKTALVLGMGLGLNTADFHRFLIEELKKAYKLPWGFKAKMGTDLLIWIWVIAGYYGSKCLLGQGLEKEGVLFQEILKSYFAIVVKGKIQHEIYNFWENQIIEIVNMDPNTYYRDWGVDYDERVKETMIAMFSLRVLRNINPKVKKMKVVEINREYEVDFRRIQNHVKTIFDFTLDVNSHYLEEADEAEIEKSFLAIRNKRFIKKILNNLRNKFQYV